MKLNNFPSVIRLVSLIFNYAVFTAFFIQLNFVLAQEVECGTIYGLEESVVITDCSNPFFVNEGTPFELLVNGISVDDGETVFVDETGVDDYYVVDDLEDGYYAERFYRHEGNDYHEIDVSYLEITLEDYQRLAFEYFGNAEDGELYVNALYYGNSNESDPEWSWDEYMDFSDYFNENYKSRRTTLMPGTYTLLAEEDYPGSSRLWQSGWLERIMDFLVPVAYAQTPNHRYALTFTIAYKQQGASSVLFLPGIQASRLYKDGLFGTEDELWVPNSNQDMGQLMINTDGQSENEVYTRDIIGAVPVFGGVYKGFSTYLDSLISDNKINDWKAYAYDWRFSVEDIAKSGTKYQNEVKNAVDILLELAEESKTGKVTIIGHSNGGLLAKAIINELEDRGEDGKVDNLILLASPQLGTPKAIGTLLHGFDQDILGGLVVSASLAREVALNMPGAYGLLPTDDYFEVYETAPIKFSGDGATSVFSAYGENIDSQAELDQFLVGELDDRVDADDIYQAGLLNANLLNKTRKFQNSIGNTWRAPEHINVTEVVGVGLATEAGFEYRNYLERKCTHELFSESCVTNEIYKPVPLISLWGDQTVITSSAEGYGGDKKTYYFNLKSFRQIKKVEHSNFTEANSVQELVRKILLDEENIDIDFISDSKTAQNIADYYLIGTHSPVSLSIKNSNGDVSLVTDDGDFYQIIDDIPGSQVYYHGSTTYIIVPINDDYEITIFGTGPGAVTIEVDEIINNQQTNIKQIYIDEVFINSKATLTIDNETFTNISFDLEGDGTIDYIYDIDTGQKQVADVLIEETTEEGGTQTKVGVRQKLSKPEPANLTATTLYLGNEDYYIKLHGLLVQLLDLLKLYAERNKI